LEEEPVNLLAIDPGSTESAYVLYDVEQARPLGWAKMPNADLLDALDLAFPADTLAIEMVASYGMSVGREVFETCVWIGRFIERWSGEFRLVYRADVKLHLTHSRRSKDPNVRQALLDKFGPGKELAVGLKKSPGPLYGLTGDCWAALGVAVTAAETREGSQTVKS
jgi:hypothetical protein